MSTTVNTATADRLIEQQRDEWPMCGRNFDALQQVRVKELQLPGVTFKVQFNPGRIASSGAKVDAKAIAERPCFLCERNRPDVQRGIDVEGRYTLLVNPFPIFPRHLTIPDNTHTPQRIAGRITDMLALAAALDGYVIFYNGPRCGASAPDHMHFQAGNADFLSLPAAVDKAPQETVATEGTATLKLCTALPVRTFVIDAARAADAEALFGRLLAAMPVRKGDEEAMMNVLAMARPHGTMRLIVIPRKRHRPSFYGTEGPGCMLISPASVDLGGVIITPREADFESVTAADIMRLIDECCLNEQEINNIARNVH